ncbi:rRNA maturation RNase YbeY [Gluconobacter cerinus]|uniref:rRNA maturation RNase YbeY n=1 Tax=Gluconobacter TaxID=441 RepID=UPI00062C4AD1|nr:MULTISPECIES: rRNA maturation RNase YbeY [Gluconobacter]MBM3098460.1 rRNA maturation RNase YbeY [Gluconobacter cerinus]
MEPPSRHAGTDIIIEDARWRSSVSDTERTIHRALTVVARQGGPDFSRSPAPSILLSTDRIVKRLNARFRNKNKPTNVLTFEPVSPLHGGDIILGYETVRKEADAAHRSMRAHLSHLVVHGALHLAGYDHYLPGEARDMEGVETRTMRQLGFGDPWRQAGRRA